MKFDVVLVVLDGLLIPDDMYVDNKFSFPSLFLNGNYA